MTSQADAGGERDKRTRGEGGKTHSVHMKEPRPRPRDRVKEKERKEEMKTKTNTQAHAASFRFVCFFCITYHGSRSNKATQQSGGVGP